MIRVTVTQEDIDEALQLWSDVPHENVACAPTSLALKRQTGAVGAMSSVTFLGAWQWDGKWMILLTQTEEGLEYLKKFIWQEPVEPRTFEFEEFEVYP